MNEATSSMVAAAETADSKDSGTGEPKPWLSILIPVYNVQDYLAECLASVRAQALQGVEVLLLDDASTDGSARLMEALAQQDGHPVRLLHHSRNQGLSAARNSLLEASRGDYLWFLDSDDLLLPGAVAAVAALVREQAAPDLILVDFRVLRARERLKHRLRGESHRRTFDGRPRQRQQSRDELVAGVFRQGLLHSWSKISRRRLWAEDLRFPVGRYYEDMYTTPELLLRATSFAYLPEVCVAYRQREGSILASMNAQKVSHMMGSLLGLPERLRAAGVQSKDAELALAQYAARTFVTACRFQQRAGGLGEAERSAALAAYLLDFERSSPLPPTDLLRATWRRGWVWRALRLAHWLGRAGVGRQA